MSGEKGMLMSNLAAILLSVCLGATGQILLKVGANSIGSLSLALATLLSDIGRVLRTPSIIIGIICFGSGFLLWVKVLTSSELSYAYPMVSLSYIIITVASHFLFNEALTLHKVMGVALIMAGVLLINR